MTDIRRIYSVCKFTCYSSRESVVISWSLMFICAESQWCPMEQSQTQSLNHILPLHREDFTALLGANHGNVAWMRERVDSCSTFPRLQIKLISHIYWATLQPESNPDSRCSNHRRSHQTKTTDLLHWTLYKPPSDNNEKQAFTMWF